MDSSISTDPTEAGDGSAFAALLVEIRGLRGDVQRVIEGQTASAPSATPSEAPPESTRYSYATAASRLGISDRKLRDHVAAGEIKPLRYGRRVVFTEAQLDAFERDASRGKARGARR